MVNNEIVLKAKVISEGKYSFENYDQLKVVYCGY